MALERFNPAIINRGQADGTPLPKPTLVGAGLVPAQKLSQKNLLDLLILQSLTDKKVSISMVTSQLIAAARN